MTRFIQLSDLHIHRTKKEDNRNCEKLVQFVIQRYSQPAEDKPVILLTGDIVDDGHADQYKAAVQLLKPLVENEFHVCAVPGNHDYGPFGNFYTEKSQDLFRKQILVKLLNNSKAAVSGITMEDLYPMVDEFDDSIFIGLDSVVANEDQLLHFASGEVGEIQLKKLEKILQDCKEKKKTKIVYFHHHPFDRSIGLEMDDAKQVFRLLAGNAEFICFGHKHKSEIWAATNDVDWIMAANKSGERNPNYKFQFREVRLGTDCHEVSMVTFSA